VITQGKAGRGIRCAGTTGVGEINVSFERQRKETSLKDKEGKWFRLLIKYFTLFHAVGTALMYRSLRNPGVRVRGTSRALDVQGRTSLETCRRCPSHRGQTRDLVIAIGLAITRLLFSTVF
jgi:hypothetical protein